MGHKVVIPEEEEEGEARKSRFHGLHPLKRFKLLLQQQQPNIESRHYCLPAKKRIWALNPPQSPIKPTFSFNDDEHHLQQTVHKNVRFDVPDEPEEETQVKKRIWPLYLPQSSIKSTFPSDDDEQHLQKTELKKVRFAVPDNPEEEETQTKEEEKREDSDDDTEEGEDGVFCNVCRGTDGNPLDPIVFCDGCDLMVHATCYGNPLVRTIPEGDWFCCRCQQTSANEKRCCLCPVTGGAVKPTTDGRWAHIVCALLVPEVFFRDPEGREGVDCSKVPRRRWEQTCYICESGNGCAIECSEPKCVSAFHICCGLEEDLCLEYREGRTGVIVVGFCKIHTHTWSKQQQTGKYKIVPRDSMPEQGKRRRSNESNYKHQS